MDGKGGRNDGRGSAGTVRGQECNGRTMTRSGRGKGLEHVKGSGMLLSKAPCNPKGNQ